MRHSGESFDLRKTFSAQLSTKFGVKLPDPGLVPSFLMVTMTTQNSFVDKAVFLFDLDKVSTSTMQEVNCEGNKSNVHIIKLHAPWPLLCRFVSSINIVSYIYIISSIYIVSSSNSVARYR